MPEGLEDDGFEEEEFDAAEFDREFMQMQMGEGGMGGMVPTDDYDGPGIVPSGQPEVPEWDQWVPESLERRQSLGEAQDRLGMSDEMRRNMADHLNPRTLEANDPTRVQQRMEEEEERQMKLAWGQELLATREQKELNFFEKPAPEEDAKLAWWEKEAQELTEAGALKMRSPIAWVDKVHDSMSEEEREFEKEINDIIIAGKRGLLRLRMQQAADIPGRKGYALQTKIKKTIRDAERLLDHHQRARGMTQEQRRRLKLRRSLALEVEYESAYGVGKFWTKKSRSWKRRWGKIV
jgi:hypothetical protein